MFKFLPVLLLACLIPIFIYSPLFRLNNIQVNDENNCLSANSIENQQKIMGKNLIFLNTAKLEKNISEKNICVTKIKLQKKYPNSISVILESESAVALIEGTDLAVREDGFISQANLAKNLPKIFLNEKIKAEAGQKITDTQTIFAITLTKKLEKTDFIPTNVRILTPPDIAIYDQKGTTVLFSQEKDADSQVDSLQSIFAKAKIDATKIAKIDLRFEKPVITTN